LLKIWRVLGPGTVTGAADDDPSGIATYSQAGAQFGYSLAWTMFLTPPFMVAIQLISAIIGWRTRSGLMGNIAEQLPKPVVYGLVILLVAANTINIAADLRQWANRCVWSFPAQLCCSRWVSASSA
jgi:Mn2+/Fe2+ NRAMP family transporter